mmetsp:Transcript_52627/g.169878  ORF Transcript_52627/g.169878 Transcript_52627/m.169878 type:complete len:247 (-) Transcript_52627:562-1302(-)
MQGCDHGDRLNLPIADHSADLRERQPQHGHGGLALLSPRAFAAKLRSLPRRRRPHRPLRSARIRCRSKRTRRRPAIATQPLGCLRCSTALSQRVRCCRPASPRLRPQPGTRPSSPSHSSRSCARCRSRTRRRRGGRNRRWCNRSITDPSEHEHKPHGRHSARCCTHAGRLQSGRTWRAPSGHNPGCGNPRPAAARAAPARCRGRTATRARPPRAGPRRGRRRRGRRRCPSHFCLGPWLRCGGHVRR